MTGTHPDDGSRLGKDVRAFVRGDGGSCARGGRRGIVRGRPAAAARGGGPAEAVTGRRCRRATWLPPHAAEVGTGQRGFPGHAPHAAVVRGEGRRRA